jgi:hypothetical protein
MSPRFNRRGFFALARFHRTGKSSNGSDQTNDAQEERLAALEEMGVGKKLVALPRK